MGSLELFAAVLPKPIGHGSVVCKASVQLTDADGVEAVASLNAHENGIPFELGIWKADFSKLIRIPQHHEAEE
jgi:hypothetical protein